MHDYFDGSNLSQVWENAEYSKIAVCTALEGTLQEQLRLEIGEPGERGIYTSILPEKNIWVEAFGNHVDCLLINYNDRIAYDIAHEKGCASVLSAYDINGSVRDDCFYVKEQYCVSADADSKETLAEYGRYEIKKKDDFYYVMEGGSYCDFEEVEKKMKDASNWNGRGFLDARRVYRAYQIDSDALNDRLRELLEIKNKSEQSVTIRDAHRTEIREYLDMLDLTVELDIVTMTDLNLKKSRTAFSQPGMRYAQAEALVKTLMRDDVFRMLSLAERNRVTERILTDIRGRMMEDIVLLETKLAKPKCEVFQLTFASGEFDMVVFDPDAASCSIYEIKHSTEKHPKQIQHLIDERKCAETEHRFGTITGKYVIYRGENDVANDIQYLNVEEYLKKLR